MFAMLVLILLGIFAAFGIYGLLGAASKAVTGQDFRDGAPMNFETASLYNDGIRFIQDERYEDALERFHQALELEPSSYIYSSISDAYTGLQDYNSAYTYAQKAVEADRNSAEAYKSLGFAFLGLEKHTQARESFAISISINRKFAQAYLGLGAAYCELGDFQSAKLQATLLDSLDPHRARVLRECIANYGY
jgi:Tfp pilus assembly protein PilF